ncbi:hypothetical protein OXX69_001430, partial [Metschnikowia pulcherrima]
MKALPIVLGVILHLLIASADTLGCRSSTRLRDGFDVIFYNYPYNTPYFQTHEYYQGQYSQWGSYATTTGVTTVNFVQKTTNTQRYPWSPVVKHLTSPIYGVSVPGPNYQNYAMEMTGWFYASKTGDYSFTQSVDDGGSIQFGQVRGCCGTVSEIVSDYVSDAWSIGQVGPWETHNTFYLVAGVYYPIKMVYVNSLTDTGFSVSYSDPDGIEVEDIGPSVFQISQEDTCITTSTVYWSETFTSSTTASPNGGVGTTTVIIEMPQTTTTKYWTESYTSTTTVTPEDGGQPTVVIDLPPTTVTTYWTESYTSTTTVTPD